MKQLQILAYGMIGIGAIGLIILLLYPNTVNTSAAPLNLTLDDLSNKINNPIAPIVHSQNVSTPITTQGYTETKSVVFKSDGVTLVDQNVINEKTPQFFTTDNFDILVDTSLGMLNCNGQLDKYTNEIKPIEVFIAGFPDVYRNKILEGCNNYRQWMQTEAFVAWRENK